MLRLLTIVVLIVTATVRFPSPAEGYEIIFEDTRQLTGPQYRDFANELAFISSAPIMGPTRPVAPWQPWIYGSHNIRIIRPVDATWITSPMLTRDARPRVHLPVINLGMGLPGDFVVSAMYGHSLNLDLQTVGVDLSYPFVKPTVTRPGLWARVSYVHPMGFEGMRMHLPALSLYLTNEFLRVPLRGNRPLTMDIRAGVQQAMVWSIHTDLENAEGQRRSSLFAPASPQFLAGLGLSYRDWSFEADLAYASSQSFIEGRNRTRSGWNQSYRVSYHWQQRERHPGHPPEQAPESPSEPAR